jgi:hypothetical protein
MGSMKSFHVYLLHQGCERPSFMYVYNHYTLKVPGEATEAPSPGSSDGVGKKFRCASVTKCCVCKGCSSSATALSRGAPCHCSSLSRTLKSSSRTCASTLPSLNAPSGRNHTFLKLPVSSCTNIPWGSDPSGQPGFFHTCNL